MSESTVESVRAELLDLKRRFAKLVSGGVAGAITALTGDVAATGPGSATATIANGAVTPAKMSGSLPLLTADPASPADDTWWAVREGTSPTQDVSIKARIGGVTYVIAAITR